MSRESIDYDVSIIGAGPAGLSAAIRLSQLANQYQFPLRICVLEKGAEVGAHSISGAVFETRALNELIPDWTDRNAPLQTRVTSDAFWLLNRRRQFNLPVPPSLKNTHNYIISLSQFTRWLAKEAENLNVDIFPGFSASELLYHKQGHVVGVATQAVGINKKGEKKENFQPGMEVRARFTLLAEGCRGSLTKELCERYHLQDPQHPQTYGIGIKEVWELEPSKHHAGKVIHTVGWPLDRHTYGGGFLYHFDKNLLSIGLIVGLDYENPYLDPYEEFQQFKRHPEIRRVLEGGRPIAYGARALNEGGLQAIPKLSFPGGLLLGCSAGFLNFAKLKGNHTAMKSGMIAAESVFEAFVQQQGTTTKESQSEKSQNSSITTNHTTPNNDKAQSHSLELSSYSSGVRHSWIWDELTRARNLRPAFRWGFWAGLVYAALDTYLFKGKAPWTFQIHRPDYLSLKSRDQMKPIRYPKPDNVITFPKLTALQWSNTFHEFDQPVHLKLKNPHLAISVNLQLYDSPEQRYCPAGVYEIVRDLNQIPRLQINAQNCIHCKTCDIKDPRQNITWVCPEGGGGPHYTVM